MPAVFAPRQKERLISFVRRGNGQALCKDVVAQGYSKVIALRESWVLMSVLEVDVCSEVDGNCSGATSVVNDPLDIVVLGDLKSGIETLRGSYEISFNALLERSKYT